MVNGQKRPHQGSFSWPGKKPLLDVQNQGSATKPTHQSKGKPGKILKPNMFVQNGGEKLSTQLKARAGKASNNASVTETNSARGSTRLSDYKSTLNVSAPAAQSQAQAEKPSGSRVIDLPDEPNLDGNEVESEQDTDGEEEDNAFQDVTNASGSKPKVKKEGNPHKVLLSGFENRKLALFANWPTFMEEFERLVKEGRCLDFVELLEQINGDPEGRDKLVRFMNYGCSAVRYDLGKETRIRTGQFYDIPGTRSSTEMISVVTWLLKDHADHRQFPLLNTIAGLHPPLHRERRIPVALIVMAMVLIGHALQEFASGYQMIHALTTTNLVSHNLQQQAAPYVERLQTDLYEAMMSAGPQVIPSQTYNYAALNQFASMPEESDQPVGDENGRGSTTESHIDVNEGHDDDHDRVSDGGATDPEPGSQGGPEQENGLADDDKHAHTETADKNGP
ncbi:hypothetical protein BT96DRAFT_1003807 [Gymnopus androsaceus JB14]|uniref:Uncharacterized protein n=1 Tax=Gymnopus androsaceus JB14 TaxID=1447944 RepID=A0A6A4GUT9_9AGAR|nr:hypothetical protein BT96DRAFT_1003807 [Gymnopus androsaceus JB14]